MATTYGAPTGLDLSACSVTATGGTTSQTLADMGKAIGDNATAVASAQSDATDAKTAATSAQTAAEAATSAISNLDNTYIPKSAIGANNGVVALDNGGGVMVPATPGNSGWVSYSSNAQESFIWMSSTEYTAAGASAPNVVQSKLAGLHFGGGSRTINGKATATAYLEVGADVFQPLHITTDLGQSDAAWANIYSVTAVQVTSDKNYKTVEGVFGDPSYVDGTKLSAALLNVKTTVYKINDAIEKKGTAARNHVGFIAQDIEAALTAAGLNPAEYALWTNSPQYELVQKDTGKKDAVGNPVYESVRQPKLDANGKQEYKQMLRYEEVLCVMVGALKEQIQTANATISSLANRISALESKAGA